jgi:hypothetical protein
MISLREAATMLAALFFWRDEITSHGDVAAKPYLESVGMHGIQPLSVEEIEQLSARIRSLPLPDSEFLNP